MTISAVGSENDSDEPLWKQAADFSLYTALFFATVSALPSCCRKKRPYVRVRAPVLGNIPVAEAPPVEHELPPPSQIERQKIGEMFEIIATGGFNLAYPSVIAKLTQYGKDIGHLHPFATIPAIPKDHMQSILKENNPFKIRGVINGMSDTLAKEHAQHNLERHVPQLARQMNKQQRQMQIYITHRQWNELLRYLFEVPL